MGALRNQNNKEDSKINVNWTLDFNSTTNILISSVNPQKVTFFSSETLETFYKSYYKR